MNNAVQKPKIDTDGDMPVSQGHSGNWINFSMHNIGNECAVDIKYYFSFDNIDLDPISGCCKLMPGERTSRKEYHYESVDIFKREVKKLKLNFIYKDTEGKNYHSGRNLKQNKRADGNYDIIGYVGDYFNEDLPNNTISNNEPNGIKENNKKFNFKAIFKGILTVVPVLIGVIWGVIQIYNYCISQKPILDIEISDYITTTTDKYSGITENWITISPTFKNNGSVPIENIRVGFNELTTSTEILSIPTYHLGNLSGKILGVNEQIILEPSFKIVENSDPSIQYRFDVRYRSANSNKEKCKTIILLKLETRFHVFEEYGDCKYSY